jgi:hypothetical protein
MALGMAESTSEIQSRRKAPTGCSHNREVERLYVIVLRHNIVKHWMGDENIDGIVFDTTFSFVGVGEPIKEKEQYITKVSQRITKDNNGVHGNANSNLH